MDVAGDPAQREVAARGVRLDPAEQVADRDVAAGGLQVRVVVRGHRHREVHPDRRPGADVEARRGFFIDRGGRDAPGLQLDRQREFFQELVGGGLGIGADALPGDDGDDGVGGGQHPDVPALGGHGQPAAGLDGKSFGDGALNLGLGGKRRQGQQAGREDQGRGVHRFPYNPDGRGKLQRNLPGTVAGGG